MEIISSFLILLILFVVLIIKLGVKIVSQADIYIIERLGRFHRVLDGGFHIIIPFFDSVRAKLSVREGLVDISRQQVITKDNVNIMVDGIVFLKVFDGRMAVYNVEDYKKAISNLAMTTLRSAIGEMSLDSTLSSRDQLNAKLQMALVDAANNWGVKIMRVEISEISVPHDIEEAMNMQMKAEREKRAIELNAQANKEALIRNAEALKQEQVLQAEAIERMADARKYEQIALAQGQKAAMEAINEAALSSHAGLEFLLANERVKAFGELAKNTSNDKILVPYETAELIGSLSVFKEFLSPKKTKNKESTEQGEI
nr:stomatin-like protein [uncultured Campylobacter sp.]